MLKETSKFYNATKFSYIEGFQPPSEMPITWQRVFYKTYPRFPRTLLKRDLDLGNLKEGLLNRRSKREFNKEPLPLEKVGNIISYASGRVEEISGEECHASRTYPSAGARYPIETYLIAFNITGIEKGVHHFNVMDNSLEQVLSKDLNQDINKFFGGSITNPAGGIILTSSIRRSETKYGIHAYRFSMIEAGHIGQNISLIASNINIGCCMLGGFENDFITNLLDLPEEEIPVYSIALGN